MSFTNVFSTQSGDVPASQLDANFVAAGNMGNYKCTAAGSNSITLTVESNQPDIGAYSDLLGVKFIAPAAPTASVQVQIGALALVPLYDSQGNQCTMGSYANEAVLVASYNATLGGFQLSGVTSGGSIVTGTILGTNAIGHDAGSNTTSTAYVAANGSVFSYTPKSISSKLRITMEFNANVGIQASTNSSLTAQMYDVTNAVAFGAQAPLQAISASIGIGASARMSITEEVTNSVLTARQFELRQKSSSTGVQVGCSSIIFTVLEIAA